jgi:predicted transcriptional regulator
VFVVSKYRDELRIIADVLHAAGSGAKKTHIMYLANLSYGLLEKYLWATVQSGFLRVNDTGYEVTDRGKAFLEKYTEFSSRCSQLERDQQSILFERDVLRKMCQPSRWPRKRNGAGRKR